MGTIDVLFIHNNFPAQYRHVAGALARDRRFRVLAFGSSTARALPGVQLFKYHLTELASTHFHPFARRFESECQRAEQVMYLANTLRAARISPRLIFVHPGWGEALPLKVMFPEARICVYCEFFYQVQGADVGFDREFPELGYDGLVRVSLRNAATLLALNDADLGVSPTRWQKSTYPAALQDKIEILHDGIDIDGARPNPSASYTTPKGQRFRAGDEVLTYVARNLEPYRGYHTFCRSLPAILRARPNLHVLIVGGSGLSYGASSPDGRSWDAVFYDEVARDLDETRVHRLGWLERADYLSVLQISAAHVYLTYPFVLSWSLLEAMSTGCLIVGSATPPVEEVIRHGETGILVPFFSPDTLARSVIQIMADPRRFDGLRRRARMEAVEQFDRHRTVPRHLDMIERLLAAG